MTGTKAFDLINVTVAALQATTGLCAPGGTGVPVYDGPVLTDSDLPTCIIIGARGFGDEDADNGTGIDAEWASLPIGAGSRHESVTVPCVAVAWSGDMNWSTLRATLRAAFDKVTDKLMTPATWDTLAGVETLVLSNMTLTPEATQDGGVLTLTFTIDATFLV